MFHGSKFLLWYDFDLSFTNPSLLLVTFIEQITKTQKKKNREKKHVDQNCALGKKYKKIQKYLQLLNPYELCKVF